MLIANIIKEIEEHKAAIDKCIKIVEAAKQNAANLKIARGSAHNLIESLKRHLEEQGPVKDSPAAPPATGGSDQATAAAATT